MNQLRTVTITTTVMAMLALWWALPGLSATPAAPVAWSALQPEQQKLLTRFQSQWSSLPPTRQQALTRGTQRWLAMDSAARAQARDRFQTWRSLPEKRRTAIRQRWERFQQLDPNARAEVRKNFGAYSQLPPGKQRLLRQRWLNATPTERAQMRKNVAAARAARPVPAPGRPHKR